MNRMHNTYIFSGAGSGTGANINIAWSLSDQPLSDAEYLAALRTIVLPVIKASV